MWKMYPYFEIPSPTFIVCMTHNTKKIMVQIDMDATKTCASTGKKRGDFVMWTKQNMEKKEKKCCESIVFVYLIEKNQQHTYVAGRTINDYWLYSVFCRQMASS